MLCTVARGKILKVISGGNALRLSGPEKVPCNRIRIVPKGDLDGPFEAVQIPIVARALVGLMLLHEWEQLLGLPSFRLKIVII